MDMPVRMGTEKLRIRRNHLRFKPHTEFQTPGMNLINQDTQSTGQLLFVDEPIAQRTIIIIAFAEPAIIHDQHFDAQFFGSVRKGNKFFGIEVEKGAFPVVDQQRTFFGFPPSPDQMAVIEPMEDATHFTDAKTSRGGQPFDVVSRPIYEESNLDGLAEQPWPTHPMQDICDVASGNAGLTVAAEGIYEYECIDNPSKALALTLLRCNNYIYQEWTTLLPEAAENIGEITYKLALFPHDGDWKAVYGDAIGYLTAPVFTLNRQPEESVMTDYVHANRNLPDAGSMLAISGDNLMITAVKQSYNGKSLIVRVLNYGDEESVGQLTLTYPARRITKVYKTDLDENRTGEIANVGNSVVFALRRAGLATFEIVMD